ncbi:MAG: sensor histidine kinase [Candidatus Levyibacteriota bacterium]
MYGDKERIGQVLTNLISNAIKYSPHATKIVIDISAAACVKDFGIGMSKNAQEKVFERFYRASGPNNQTFPGLGLGLYISSEIIKRLGGRIWVESVKGKGSTFCFTLPTRKRKVKKHRYKLAVKN